MSIALGTPGVQELGEVVAVLGDWQADSSPMQLHPGDLGWFWRSGAEATAAAVRIWRRDGRILAVGLLDGPGLLRLTTAPDVRRDEELARRTADDAADPGRGVLPAGPAYVEAPQDALLQEVLEERGWGVDEPWTPLCRSLTGAGPVPAGRAGLRIEVIGAERSEDFATVQRSAFDGSTFTAGRWRAMAGGPQYSQARSLVGYDVAGVPVAAVVVWSAGPGRPGLLEPMGVHREHRGRGYGRAICLAAAAQLRELGASTALVCTPTALPGAVATYASAGYRPLPEVRDRVREEVRPRVD